MKIGAVNESSGNFTFGYDYYAERGSTLNLYYDTDLDPGNGKTLVAAVPLSASGAGAPFPSSGTRPWNTASVPTGTYYIYAEITDGLDTRGWYASGPLVITSPPVPLPDADGDGLPDAFEIQYGLNPNSAAGSNGANGDPDGDGFTNMQEFHARFEPGAARGVRRTCWI